MNFKKLGLLVIASVVSFQISTAHAMVGFFRSSLINPVDGTQANYNSLDIHYPQGYDLYLIGAGAIISQVGVGLMCCCNTKRVFYDEEGHTVVVESGNASGLSLAFAGTVMVGSEDIALGELTPLSQKEADAAQLSATELESWNRDVALLEVSRQSILADLQREGKLTKIQAVEFLKNAWASELQVFSCETQVAFAKIMSLVIKNSVRN